MASAKKYLIIPGLVLLAAGLAAAAYFGHQRWQEHRFLTTAPESPGREARVRIEPGTTFLNAARQLKQAGLITETPRFVLLARQKGLTAKLRAGEFILNTGMVPGEVLETLTSSPGVLVRVQVREGLTWWQTAQRVEEAGLGSFESFERAAKDPDLLREFNIQADTAEGYLFPETYLMTRPEGDDARPVVEAMLAQFARNAAKVWPDGPPNATEMRRVVTLASLVEKETGDTTERERIAGVFANRLKRRMLIQADPTVIYGLGDKYDGNLRRSHLEDASNPYNTYRRRGLPPGPICSPGLDALLAAAHPEEHKYLYFVAKGDGSHHFSTNLKDHNKAVQTYQLRRNRKTYRSY